MATKKKTAAKKSNTKTAAPRRAPRRAAPASNPAGENDRALRAHLRSLLRGGSAHADFAKAIEGLPADLRGATAPGIPFTPWQLLEHIRIAQWDILEFSRDARHVSPEWPAGYWPESGAPPNPEAWDESVAAVRSGARALERLIANPKTDLFARIPHGDGQTVLREALLTADHNAYHIGQIVLVRRALGAWKES